ncbi:DNA damage-induced apoptosis suppressor protein [Protobothrops mucrosquamatus]|uniref:DNA damage-induced apoptosis suppressor protein n=1 Tax=Protobothrops mucrosquamatus TaxID=103944 RepID=UPI0010FB2AE3|nr:DNA damage-induced apoptosis suppressor protein [Protobothrops mucrosquamatus]
MNGGHFLVASVISIQNSSFVYPSCHSCFSRLSLQFKRYNCQKCGGSGDTKEANYRYRLSLEVADTHDVFEITVFGSCLDAYFGATAKGLQRYIEELNREAGEDENDAVFGVIFRAVETCFVGKKFVFRIKSSDRPGVASLLQNGCPTERSTKTFVASEMFVPHPELVGHTVLHYMEQQRCSQLKQRHGALWLPDHVTASDHPMGASAPKTSTPIAGSLFKSECSLVGTLDFSAGPHSIPLARPYHPDSLLAGKGPILSDLPLNKLSWDKAKCKRPRLPFQNPLVKQLISKFSRSTRSSNAEAGTVNPCGPPELFVSRLSAKGLQSKDGGQEWSPPSEKIQDRDVKLQRRKSLGGFHSDSPLFEKQGGCLSPSNLSRLAKVCFLPKKPQPEEAGIEGQPTCQQTTMLGPPVTESLDKPSFVDLSRSKLFPTPSSPVPQVADWSSELFPDHDHLPNPETTVSQPTS